MLPRWLSQVNEMVIPVKVNNKLGHPCCQTVLAELMLPPQPTPGGPPFPETTKLPVHRGHLPCLPFPLQAVGAPQIGGSGMRNQRIPDSRLLVWPQGCPLTSSFRVRGLVMAPGTASLRPGLLTPNLTQIQFSARALVTEDKPPTPALL